MVSKRTSGRCKSCSAAASSCSRPTSEVSWGGRLCFGADSGDVSRCVAITFGGCGVMEAWRACNVSFPDASRSDVALSSESNAATEFRRSSVTSCDLPR